MLNSLSPEAASFMPHGFCFLWTPSLLWTYVFSDSIITASYYSIPIALWYFVRKRQDLPYRWIFILFALFVMSCGTTHLFAILNIWQADYWADASVKVFTAIFSAISAVALWRIMPFALALPSTSQLEIANNKLQNEMKRREHVEAVLLNVNKQLEERVAERTADLSVANTKLLRMNRALTYISTCNELLIHATDESQLLKDMCRIIVEIAGYKMAWVGFAEHDEGKTVRPATHSGYEEGYIERAKVTWADNEHGHGPTGTAIRTQQPAIIMDTLNDPSYLPWRYNGIKLGYRSILSLPLVSHGQVLGALTIYSPDVNGFSKEEIELLDQLSDDLAFGILTLRIRKLEEQSAERLLRSLDGTINAVSVIVELRDPYTAGHERHVAQLAVAIGKELGLPESQVEGLSIAGRIHDIGKIAIPAEMLSKPTRLTEIEYSLIKEHSQAGFNILQGIEFPWPVAQAVLQHHERLDGSGYPQGLKRDEIVLEARILSVADVVEAMSSHRPYRAGLGINAALDEIERNRGVLYCEKAVDACIKLFRERDFKFAG